MNKNYNLKSIISIFICQITGLSFGQTTFNYTGAFHKFTVPYGFNSFYIEDYGGSGWYGNY